MRILRFIFRALLFLTLAIAIAGGLLVFQMSNGSLSAGFLKGKVVAALQMRLPAGSSVGIEDLLVSFGPNWSLVVESPNLSVSVPGRGQIVAGDTRIDLAPEPLMAGIVEPVSLTIDSLSMDITGQSMEPPSGSRGDFVRSAMLQMAKAVLNGDRLLDERGLESIDISNIRISGEAIRNSPLADGVPIQVSALHWRPSGADGGLEIRFASVHGNWTLGITPGVDADARVYADIKVTDFPPAFVVPRIADPTRRPYYDAIADMQGRVQLDQDGQFDVARMHMTLGPGYLSMLENAAAIIDRVDVAMELSADSDRLSLARSDIRFGGTHIVLRGGLDLASFGEPIGYAAELGPTRLAPFGERQEPVILENGMAKGSIDMVAGAILLDGASISGPEGAARAAGAFRFQGDAPGLSGAVTIEETTVRMARALWLPIIARKTRSWFDRNVKSALLGPGTVQIALPMENLGDAGRDRPLPSDGVVGELPFRYGLFTPLRDLPLVRNAFGSLQFTDATAIVKLTAADVTVAGMGVASVGPTEFRIPNLGKPDPVGYLDLDVAGPAAALAQISNAGRLQIAEDRGLSPAALSGDAKLGLQAAFSLVGKSRQNEINAEFDLQLSKFASDTPIAGQLISGGTLAVRGNTETFSVTGNAKIDGIPAKIDVTSSGKSNQSTVRLTMDEEARRKLGIDLGSMLVGDVITSVTPQADGRIQDISVDLRSAAVNLPFLGWQKGASVPATLKARIERTANGIQVRDIVVYGDGFQASGDLDIDSRGRLVRLEMDDIALKPGDDFAISAKAAGKGYKINISGASFDARGLISVLQSSPSGIATSDQQLSLSLNLALMRGFNGVSLSGVSGAATFSGGKVRDLSLQAGTSAAQPLELVIREESSERSIDLRSANGGALLRFMNIYDKAYGGDLMVRFAGSSKAQDGRGELVINNFRVQNEQAFDQAAIERRIRTDRDREVRSTDRLTDTSNLSFSILRIPFTKSGDAIVISDASLRGSVIGASSKGTVDLAARNLSLSGTIVPAYGINNLPGSIPILGQLLGGRNREGLIGITYRMFGPIDAPTLKLNPASAIAPGILRRIFEY